MSEVTISGSKNGFAFGPVALHIDVSGIDASSSDEKSAVLDALLRAEDTDVLDIVLSDAKGDVSQRAAARGFTALCYRRDDGASVQII